MQKMVAGASLAFVVMAAQTSAIAKNVTIPVHLTLTVADSCTVRTPSILRPSGGGPPAIALDSVMPDCRIAGVSATLHVERASPKEGSYIATIDF